MARPRKAGNDLPQYVHYRHGAYYYVRANKWVRLGPNKEDAMRLLPLAQASVVGADGIPTDALYAHVQRLVNASRIRARKLEVGFDLTVDGVIDLIRKSGGRCAVTGTPFTFVRYGYTDKRPFAPSIDRIASNRGYTGSNSRVVCVMANIAMNAWGEGALKEMLEHHRTLQESVEVLDKTPPIGNHHS